MRILRATRLATLLLIVFGIGYARPAWALIRDYGDTRHLIAGLLLALYAILLWCAARATYRGERWGRQVAFLAAVLWLLPELQHWLPIFRTAHALLGWVLLCPLLSSVLVAALYVIGGNSFDDLRLRRSESTVG
jgi:hypothetical protein